MLSTEKLIALDTFIEGNIIHYKKSLKFYGESPKSTKYKCAQSRLGLLHELKKIIKS